MLTKELEKGLSGYKVELEKLIKPENLIKEIGFASQAVQASQKLQKCDQASIFKAVYNVALTGLSLNPIHKLAALTPRWNTAKGGDECVLMPQYQGLVKLLTDTGSVKSAYAHLVYKGDEFEVSLGTSQEIIHKPKFQSKEIEMAYAVGVLHDGSKEIEVMTIADLHAIRELSDSYKAYKAGKVKSAIWVDHEGEMCRKTVLKRLCKYLPKTDRWEKVANAIEVDNEDYQASMTQVGYIESLLHNSTLDEAKKKQIELSIGSMSHKEAEVIITMLKENQLKSLNEQFDNALRNAN